LGRFARVERYLRTQKPALIALLRKHQRTGATEDEELRDLAAAMEAEWEAGTSDADGGGDGEEEADEDAEA